MDLVYFWNESGTQSPLITPAFVVCHRHKGPILAEALWVLNRPPHVISNLTGCCVDRQTLLFCNIVKLDICYQAFSMKQRIMPYVKTTSTRLSVHLSATYYQRLNYLSDFHEIRYKSFTQHCQAGVSFVQVTENVPYFLHFWSNLHIIWYRTPAITSLHSEPVSAVTAILTVHI